MALTLEGIGTTSGATSNGGGGLALAPTQGIAASRAAGGASVTAPREDLLGELEDEAAAGSSGLNLAALLGGGQAQDPSQSSLEGGQTKEAELMLIALLEQITQLMMQMQQQQAAGDQPGAAQTQDQISALQNQMSDLLQPSSAPSSSPSYSPASGAASSPASSGGSSAAGSPASGSAPESGGAPGAGAVTVDPSSMGEGTEWGRNLAAEAFSHAGAASQGLCYKFVGEDLRKFGVQTSGAGAYMAADQLAQSDKFQEVKGLANNDLKKLPAGAVVVWNRGNGHEWGHISIADGKGNEASDFKGPQITNYGTSYRVFLPKGSRGAGQQG